MENGDRRRANLRVFVDFASELEHGVFVFAEKLCELVHISLPGNLKQQPLTRELRGI